MSEGVPITDLHCPTCGAAYPQPLTAERDLDAFDVDRRDRIIVAVPDVHWYITCPSGHRWTLKMFFRAPGEPDGLLLGRFLGP